MLENRKKDGIESEMQLIYADYGGCCGGNGGNLGGW